MRKQNRDILDNTIGKKKERKEGRITLTVEESTKFNAENISYGARKETAREYRQY